MAEGSSDITPKEDIQGSTDNTISRCSGVNVIGNITGQNVTVTANVTRQVTGDWIRQKIQMIYERTVSRMQLWTKDMVRTSALEKVLDKLDKGTRWLTIKGSPGEGKTTCAYMALEELHRRGRQVFQVLTPDEYLEVTRNSSQSVIMLDDILGDLEFNEAEWIKWKAVLHDTLRALEHRSHIQVESTENVMTPVILVGRDYVFNSASRDLGKFSDLITHERHVIEMSQRVERDLEEKRNIWNAIVQSSGIELKMQEISIICSMKLVHGFPHVCRLFVTAYNENKGLSAVSFFGAPLQFLNKTIEKLLDDNCKLILFKEIIKGSGKISTRDLGCLDGSFKIIKMATDLVGTYLKKVDDNFQFDHPSVYDCVAYNLCKLYPLFVIDNCDLSFIHQRLRLQHIHKDSTSKETQHVVHIPKAYLRDLAKRFADGIQNGHLFYTLTHVACTDREFVEQMMSMVSIPVTRLLNLIDNESGEQFLMLITQNRSSELFRYIDGKTDIRDNHIAVQTVLLGVCTYGSSDLLLYLKEIGCYLDINAYFDSRTFAMLAVSTKDEDFISQILSLSPDLSAKSLCGCKTLLHYLCEGGYLSAADRAIDMGASMYEEDEGGETAFSIARGENNVELLRMLYDKEGRIDIQAAGRACEEGNTDVIKAVLSTMISASGGFLLRNACRFEQLEVISCLIDKGVSVNTLSEVGQTPLHEASFDRPLAVGHLIHHGAHLNSRDREGDTPLHVAAFMGSEECVNVLLGAGVDVNAQNKRGSTPLHRAVQAKSKICVELLLKAGTEVNIQSNNGSTPLHMAAYRKSVECVAPLLTAGADVNMLSQDGSTPLHRAAGGRDHLSREVLLKAGAENVQSVDRSTDIKARACIKLLLKAGAHINIQCKDGSTPLHTSAVKGAHACVDALLRAGADVTRQNNFGHTPLQEAIKRLSELQKIGFRSYSYTESEMNLKMCIDMILEAENDIN